LRFLKKSPGNAGLTYRGKASSCLKGSEAVQLNYVSYLTMFVRGVTVAVSA